MERMLSKNQTDHAEKTQQTRDGTQHRLGDILSRRFKTQVGTHLLKCGFDRPAGRKPTENLFGPSIDGGVDPLVS